MKLTTMVMIAATGLLLTTGYANAEGTQQEKMKNCNAVAKRRNLKGDERKEFMKTCLSAGPGEAAVGTKPASSPQEKMKACNKLAKAKNLKGADRESFMKDCLSGK